MTDDIVEQMQAKMHALEKEAEHAKNENASLKRKYSELGTKLEGYENMARAYAVEPPADIASQEYRIASVDDISSHQSAEESEEPQPSVTDDEAESVEEPLQHPQPFHQEIADQEEVAESVEEPLQHFHETRPESGPWNMPRYDKKKTEDLVEMLLYSPTVHLKDDCNGDRPMVHDDEGNPLNPQLLYKAKSSQGIKFEANLLSYADAFTEEMQKLDTVVNLPLGDIQYIPVYRHTKLMTAMVKDVENSNKIEASRILSIAFELLPYVAGRIGLPVLKIETKFGEQRTLTNHELSFSRQYNNPNSAPPIVLIPQLYVKILEGSHPSSERVKKLLCFENLYHLRQIIKRKEQLNVWAGKYIAENVKGETETKTIKKVKLLKVFLTFLKCPID